jgi:putative transposase
MTVSRPPRLRVGDEVLLNGSTHAVGGVSATQVRLTDVTGTESVWSLADLFSSAGFRVLTQPRASLPPQGLLEGLAAEVADQARWWEDHIVEVITGVRPQAGARAKPRSRFDPSTRSLRQRELAKVSELADDGRRVPLSTLQRLRLNYEKRGVWGLVDQRVAGRRGTKTDERVLQAIGQAVAEETNRSTGTVGRLRRRRSRSWSARTGSIRRR